MTTNDDSNVPEVPEPPRDFQAELEAKQAEVERLEAERAELNQTLAETTEERRVLKERNERLVTVSREAREQLVALREEVDRLAKPPAGYGVIRHVYRDDDEPVEMVDVFTAGREMCVTVSPNVDAADLTYGRKVRLNEALTIVKVLGFEETGTILPMQEVLEDGKRVVVTGATDERQLVWLAEPLLGQKLKAGDLLLVDVKSAYAYELIPQTDLDNLGIEEVPDIRYEDIGGLDNQIEQITDAVELPFLHADLYKEMQLKPPKGVLLYGPPGCGKTMIAKAVANSLAKRLAEKAVKDGKEVDVNAAKAFFVSVNGPELLNKYVGETERHIRMIFQKARNKATEGNPVIIFFDEMDSIFRTRGSGVSSDVETTIVPQLLSEMDGVEELENVIVIGASNREDNIDPAVLRAGRLDIKIKVERPDKQGARDIFDKYLTDSLPLHDDILKYWDGNHRAAVSAMIRDTVDRMYEETKENEFLEVTYASGNKDTLYFKDFNSGAMIHGIVDRAKRMAIKAFLNGDGKGLKRDHLYEAVAEEFRQNEDLPNTTSPDDWARISGKKGERIVYIRTIIDGHADEGKAIETAAPGGQYL